MSDHALSFEGWMGPDRDSAKGQMVWQKFEPKKWEETDVDIRITHCGVCASDLCVLRSGWVNRHPLLSLPVPSMSDLLPLNSVQLPTLAASATKSSVPSPAWDHR
jgi:hypothetical protein